MFDLASAAPAAATLPLVPAASPARQGFGPDSCRDVAGAIARARPCDRQPGIALGDGDRVLRQRRRRRLGVEGRLRGARSGAGHVPAQIRRRDAHPRRLGRGDARDADAPRRAAADPDPPLGGIRALPAILDAVSAWLCRRRSGHADRRPISCSNRRPAPACWRSLPNSPKRSSRSTRSPIPAPDCSPPVPRARSQPPQCRADPRPARSGDPAERGADEPALFGLASYRRALCRSRDPPCPLRLCAARRRRTARRHHRP